MPLPVMLETAIVVIGCSEGGLGALSYLAGGFEAAWPASIFITSHIGRGPSALPQLLNAYSTLPVSHAREFETFLRGHVYIAPPNHHLCIGHAKLELSVGPRVNWTRPAIDPMFMSAAHAHGRAVIGILLTGNLSDGVNGLSEVQACGGQTIVQDPSDARASGMPRNALRRIVPDYVVPLIDMPKVISSCISRTLAKLTDGADI